MTTKAIKGVSEETWNKFKAQAASKGMEMAEYFGLMVAEVAQKDTQKWLKGLFANARKNALRFTAEDAEKMREFRKRFAMRKFQ